MRNYVIAFVVSFLSLLLIIDYSLKSGDTIPRIEVGQCDTIKIDTLFTPEMELKDSVEVFIEKFKISTVDIDTLPITRKEKINKDSLFINHFEIVLAQAKLESGHFTSKIFKDNNNMFGMRLPYKRATLAVGENNGYAVYEHWTHSIIDYALYQDYGLVGQKSKNDYLIFLKNNYAIDPFYINKIS